MKKTLLMGLLACFAVSEGYSQSDKFWSAHKGEKSTIVTDKSVSRASFPKKFDLFRLNTDQLRQTLFKLHTQPGVSKVIISLPNVAGQLEQFEMYEASNFEADLQAQFPEIRAYTGKGITDKYATLKLSISPQGIQTMVFRTDKENEFIEPYSQDHTIYAVFKSQREKGSLNWTCSTDDQQTFSDISGKIQNVAKSSAGQLKTMRLAQSVTGEYSNYFGATNASQVGLVLAAINNTLTRCNGVYEKDLALHLNLVASSTNVIYYNPATDPYSNANPGAGGAWNTELQNTLSTSLTGPSTSLAANNAAYDIGHLFGASGGGGNAGCIGCVCTDDTALPTDKNKGSGFTSPADNVPAGDNFDIDYVTHEVGHQLGANHTFSMSNEGSGVNMEVGSGVTIMGYAGITQQDVAPHSIDIFHATSIAQIQARLATKTCPVTTNITANNATPVVNAGADYTIPKSTPFMLTGSATDANTADVLTYCWEQYDNSLSTQTGNASAASETKTTGPNFRTYPATASPVRYFPTMASVLNGQTTTQGSEIPVEALSSVARILNFRLTVRDNAPYVASAPAKVGQTNFDDMIVTVDATKGPLTVTSQNTDGISWLQGSTQTITWTVNGTNSSPGGSNVDILLSTDGGLTFPTVLVANTPNDGSQSITVPNLTAQYARIMVKASGNIFFNVNTKSIAIGYTVTTNCNTYSNNNLLTVPDGIGSNVPGAVVSKTISIPDTNTISDVNVTLGINHNYIEDLVVGMNHPDNTQVLLWNRNCDNTPTSLTYVFSDGNPTVPAAGCTATTGTFAPATSLSTLNGKPANGTWTLLAADYFNQDTGSIGTWSVEVCSQTFTLATENFGLENFAIYPNPNNGNFAVEFDSNTTNDIKIGVHDMRGRLVFEKTYQNTGTFNHNIQLNNVQTGIYLVTVQDGDRKEVKKISIK